ncbi:MAG: hypothetical protein ACI9MB_004062 [Verrucomicrobiales bacterium]
MKRGGVGGCFDRRWVRLLLGCNAPLAGDCTGMNAKALFIFIAGLVLGGGGYHLLGGKGDGGDVVGDAPSDGALGSMLGKEDVAKPEKAENGQAIAMPEGFEDVDSITDIMTKAGPRDRFQALMSFVEGINTHEIEEALKELRANTTNQFDPEAMFAGHLLLMRWGEEDSEAAFASLEKLGMMERAFGSMSVLAAVAADDPRAAADWLTAPTNLIAAVPRAGDFMATTVSKEWAKNDPDAALAWAKSLPEGKRAGAYNGVLGSLASDDPQRASAMALDLEEGKDRTNLIGNIAESWGKKEPAAALEWVQGLEEGGERDQAMSKTLGGWAQAEPAKAAEYLDQMADEEKAAHVGAVAGPWARQDPSAAATWLGDQPEGEGKNDGMKQVMWMWTATEPEAASTWIGEQPAGPSRDQGIVSMSNTTYDQDPQMAITWAAEISDDGMRTQQVSRGVNRYMKDEPQAAAEWVGATDVLSEVEKAEYLKSAETGDGE